MEKTIRIVLTTLLAASACCLAWMCYDSVTTPIKFNESREYREGKVIDRLKDIRRAEAAYKSEKGEYTASFDTLIDYVKNAKEAIVLKEGELTDEQLNEGMTEKKAVALGLIKRDTTYVSVLASLFGESYPIDSIRYIPFSDGQEFELAKAEIMAGNVPVKVMEAKAPFASYLSGLDKQELINLTELEENLGHYAGTKFGDINSANNNAGNWE